MSCCLGQGELTQAVVAGLSVVGFLTWEAKGAHEVLPLWLGMTIGALVADAPLACEALGEGT